MTYYAVKKTEELKKKGIEIKPLHEDSEIFLTYHNGCLLNNRQFGYENALKYAQGFIDGVNHDAQVGVVIGATYETTIGEIVGPMAFDGERYQCRQLDFTLNRFGEEFVSGQKVLSKIINNP